MFRLVLALALFSAAMARPQQFSGTTPIPIISDNRYGPDESGAYSFNFETGNGIRAEEQGQPIAPESFAVQGAYSYTAPEGVLVEVSYAADEGGFRADSPFIPTPHPLPAHAIEQIRIAEEQARQGIRFDHRGFRIQ
ncbi:cuticle protein AM1199-like [Oratosquilla oratoria]|uniref:cuticle protein AM1199-like n=1 Tax=Oratosquilla oratoria TaxID=337810 RepID=UPI003F76641A